MESINAIPLSDAWEWLYHAEEARKAAERLTDRDAKEVMLQLGRYYPARAQPLTQAGARGQVTLRWSPRSDRLS